jgi:hypothetical protein
MSQGPVDSACRHKGESPDWETSLGECQPRLVAHTVSWYACHATLYGTDYNYSSASRLNNYCS